MKQILPLVIISFALVLGCQKENSISWPIGEYAIDWVPQNEDSILFIHYRSGEKLYLNNLAYNRYFEQVNDTERIEICKQSSNTIDGSFSLTYVLSAGKPMIDSLGINGKIDRLALTGTPGNYFVDISKNSFSTSLSVVDSFTTVTGRNYFNVLTDSTTFFISPESGILQIAHNGKWFNRIP